MKKLLLSLFLISSFCTDIFAQSSLPPLRIGVKLAGSFVTNRVKDNDNTFDVDKDGTAFKGAFGVLPEFLIGEKYYFSTGLMYQPKGIRLQTNSFTEKYRVQYLQIPLGLKLLTNDINDQLKAYINLGSSLDFKIGDNFNDDNILIDRVRTFDLSLFAGIGVEFGQIGNLDQTFALGVQYMRGLLDNLKSGADLDIKTNVWNIELIVFF